MPRSTGRKALLVALAVFGFGATARQYAPSLSDVEPPDQLVRPASDGLHALEIEYLRDRQELIQDSLRDYYLRAEVDFDEDLHTDAVIGLAFSGGGYRAMLSGAGQFAALDSRTEGAGEYLGGILQASSYISGLSGGSWLLGSVYFNNFSAIPAVLEHPRLWQLERPMFVGSEPTALSTFQLYESLFKDVLKKKAEGFSVTVTDFWGRVLAKQFLDHEVEGPRLWSDLRHEDWFRDRSAPYPLVSLIHRSPVYRTAHIGSSVLEVSPFELGSFDSEPGAFADIEYLGTPAYNGKPLSKSLGVVGLDDAGFLLGASSSLFDQIFVGVIEQLTTSKSMAEAVRLFLQQVSIMELRDVGAISPNPFLGFSLSANQSAAGVQTESHSPILYVADGGGNGQVVPVQPLLQPERRVDALFAFDNGGSNLYTRWPDGTSLVKSYQRQFVVAGSPAFPYVPDRNTFVNLGLASRPTFFGCDGNNLTDLMERANQTQPPPVVVYIPNGPYSDFSNTSTFQLAYSREKMASMVTNGFDTTTQGNGTLDAEWPACVACAISQRSRERQQELLTPQCFSCFQRYCWSGNVYPDDNLAAYKMAAGRELLL